MVCRPRPAKRHCIPNSDSLPLGKKDWQALPCKWFCRFVSSARSSYTYFTDGAHPHPLTCDLFFCQAARLFLSSLFLLAALTVLFHKHTLALSTPALAALCKLLFFHSLCFTLRASMLYPAVWFMLVDTLCYCLLLSVTLWWAVLQFGRKEKNDEKIPCRHSFWHWMRLTLSLTLDQVDIGLKRSLTRTVERCIWRAATLLAFNLVLMHSDGCAVLFSD